MQSTTNGGKALDRLFLFCVGEPRGRKKKCAFFVRKMARGMLFFVVADIWNCYNVGMKKRANLEVKVEEK